MKFLKQTFGKDAKYLLRFVLCLVMIAGTYACSNEEELLTDQSKPRGTDDASLIAWQMEKHFKTRSANYDIAIVTTKSSFSFNKLDLTGVYDFIDWGDGCIESNTVSHTYTDGEPAHTIFVYAKIPVNDLNIIDQEVIFLDVSRVPSLVWLQASENRISNIDLSNTPLLSLLLLNNNKLHAIDLNSNTQIETLQLGQNPLTMIDVTPLQVLKNLSINETQLTSIDVSQNSKLELLEAEKNNFTTLDVTNNPELESIWIDETLISNIDFSNNPKLSMIQACLSNVTSLNLSNNPQISSLNFFLGKLNDIVLPANTQNLRFVDISNTPIEQNLRKLTSLVLSLPDRNGTTEGHIRTNTTYLSTVQSLLDGFNWRIN